VEVRDWENVDDIEVVIRPLVRWTMNILALESVVERAAGPDAPSRF